jgi:Family of unknown function (DUF6879)
MVADAPTVRDLLHTCTDSAWHLEMRDGYMRDDPKFLAWQQGMRHDPAQRHTWWRPWLDVIADATRRGVQVRRARIVSEPISTYIRFEFDITFTNIAAGEQVSWLPRRQATDVGLPGNDFWLFDQETVLVNHFGGDGQATGFELITDQAVVRLCHTAFEAVWQRAIPHDQYQPS